MKSFQTSTRILLSNSRGQICSSINLSTNHLTRSFTFTASRVCLDDELSNQSNESENKIDKRKSNRSLHPVVNLTIKEQATKLARGNYNWQFKPKSFYNQVAEKYSHAQDSLRGRINHPPTASIVDRKPMSKKQLLHLNKVLEQAKFECDYHEQQLEKAQSEQKQLKVLPHRSNSDTQQKQNSSNQSSNQPAKQPKKRPHNQANKTVGQMQSINK